MTTTWPLTAATCLALALAACAGTTSASQDTVSSTGDSQTATDATTSNDVAASESFVCTQVMGLSVTGEWYAGGFETAVPDGHWQAITLSHAYVDLWADPTNTVWTTPVTSPCTVNPGNPDRVLFTGCNWEYTTEAEWTTALTTVVTNLTAKYPALKRIELLTMLRAPGNQSCPDALNKETIVAPYIDTAIAKVVAAHPELVIAAPKFEAPNCEVFILGGPHFTPDGQAEVAKVYSAHYASKP